MYDVFQPGYRGFLVRNVEAKALAAGRASDVNCIGHNAAQRALFDEDESCESFRPFEHLSIDESSDGKHLDLSKFIVFEKPEPFSEE